MKSKKQLRFERRLAERRLLRQQGLLKTSRQRRSERRSAERALREQGGVTKVNGERVKEPAVDPDTPRVTDKCSKNPSPRIPGFQEPGKYEVQPRKETDR
jgi:hypothetical protein